jgi:membrane-associated phospholipid phosphatase
MKNFFYSTILVIIFIPVFAKAQNEYNFKQFANEAENYYSAPLHWNKNDFLTFGIITATTFTAMQFDDLIKNETAKINSERKNWLMEAGRYWGEPIPSFILSGALLIHGISNNNETTKKIGFEIGQSFFYSVSVTSGLKIIIGRSRPYTGNLSTVYSPFSFGNDNLSLPSGHTTVAFSLSSVLAANTNNDGLKILAFIPAILTATSRVYQNYHWTSDVVLGAAIGYFTGKFVTDLHKQNEKNPNLDNIPLISFSLSL